MSWGTELWVSTAPVCYDLLVRHLGQVFGAMRRRLGIDDTFLRDSSVKDSWLQCLFLCGSQCSYLDFLHIEIIVIKHCCYGALLVKKTMVELRYRLGFIDH